MKRVLTSILGVLGLLLLSACNQEEFYAKEYLTPYNKTVSNGNLDFPDSTPTGSPEVTPTVNPTVGPSVTPTPVPPVEPTIVPTVTPTVTPPVEPTIVPTVTPTVTPPVEPTIVPTITPTVVPTVTPPPSASLTFASEHFTQKATQEGKIDILWVIDNSGSMGDDQDALARNFDIFIQDFIQKNIDFRMAITTTDDRRYYNGVEVCGANKLSLANAQNNPSQFYYDFQNCVRVGSSGSSVEKGLNGMNEYLRINASRFLRPDAYLAVIVLSDENDQSSLSVDQYVQNLKAYKTQAGLLKYYGIITTTLVGTYSSESIGTRYQEMRNSLGGSIAEIKEDFYMTLSDMGQSLVKLVQSFAIAHSAVGPVTVKVNGVVQTQGWSYDAQTRSVLFEDGFVPAEGSDITVEYYWEQH